MEELATKFLVDGIDRLGKSTLIKGIMAEMGYHLVIHYDKPQVLHNNLISAENIKNADPTHLDELFAKYQHLSKENIARLLYQINANSGMFELLKSEVPIIFDRTHLGEMVYAPMYRGYNGDYVYDMEKSLISEKPYSIGTDIRLILLTSSNTDMLVDDGLSFDPTKKAEEQERFKDAFNKSQLPNKIMIDVHNGRGGYREYSDILKEALYKRA